MRAHSCGSRLTLRLLCSAQVILFDSDWNPQMDAQAQDRAHRIGQKNEVRVLRLVTNSPIEDKILNSAKSKLNINACVVEAGKFNKGAAEASGTTAERDRRATIEALLKKSEGEDESDELEGDEEINMMMAVGQDEFELYQQMDLDTHARKVAEARAMGRDKPLTRLMLESEAPAWVRQGSEGMLEAEEPEALARAQEAELGKWARKTVEYSDGLTETQFLKQCEMDPAEAGGVGVATHVSYDGPRHVYLEHCLAV